MKKLFKHLRILSVAAAVALAAQPLSSIATSSDVRADPYRYHSVMSPAVTGGSGSAAGGWIIGSLVFSVASIIACAMIVGAEEDREMTLEEALLSGAIPLGCLLREQLASQ